MPSPYASSISITIPIRMDIWFVIVLIYLLSGVPHCMGKVPVKLDIETIGHEVLKLSTQESTYGNVKILDLSTHPACSPASRPVFIMDEKGEFGISAENDRRLYGTLNGSSEFDAKLDISSSEVGEPIMGENSSITEPNGDNRQALLAQVLPFDLQCEWLVYSLAPATIAISIDWVKIGRQSDPCRSPASLSLYAQDSADTSAPPKESALLKRVCWHDPFLYPISVETDAYVRVVFRTDTQTTGLGFGIMYVVSPRDDPISASTTPSPSVDPSESPSSTEEPDWEPSTTPIPSDAEESASPTPSMFWFLTDSPSPSAWPEDESPSATSTEEPPSESSSESPFPFPSSTPSVTQTATETADFYSVTRTPTPTISLSSSPFPYITTTTTPFHSDSATPTRTRLKPADDQDCVLSDWSPWTTCAPISPLTDPCGTGTRTRHRTVVKPPTGAGKPCPPPEKLRETEKCQVPCLPPACIPASRPVVLDVPGQDLVVGTPLNSSQSFLSANVAPVYLPPGTLCEWHVPPGVGFSHWAIAVKSVSIPKSPNCSAVNLSVHSLFAGPHDTLLDSFCGDKVPRRWVIIEKQDSLLTWIGDGFVLRLRVADAPELSAIETGQRYFQDNGSDDPETPDGVPVGLWLEFVPIPAYSTSATVPFPPAGYNKGALLTIPCNSPCHWLNNPSETVRRVARSLPYILQVDPDRVVGLHVRPVANESAILVFLLAPPPQQPALGGLDSTVDVGFETDKFLDAGLDAAMQESRKTVVLQSLVRELFNQLADPMSALRSEPWGQQVHGNVAHVLWLKDGYLHTYPEALEIPLPLPLTQPLNKDADGIQIAVENTDKADELVYKVRLWNSGNGTLMISNVQLLLPEEFVGDESSRKLSSLDAASSNGAAFVTLESVYLPNYLYSTDGLEITQNSIEIALRLHPEHAPDTRFSRVYYAHLLITHSAATNPVVYPLVFPVTGTEDTSIIDQLLRMKIARDALLGSLVVLLVSIAVGCAYTCCCRKNHSRGPSISSSISSSSSKASSNGFLCCKSLFRSKKEKQGYSPPSGMDDDEGGGKRGGRREGRKGLDADGSSSSGGSDDEDGDGSLMQKRPHKTNLSSIPEEDTSGSVDLESAGSQHRKGTLSKSDVVLEMTSLPKKTSNDSTTVDISAPSSDSSANTPLEVSSMPSLSLTNIPGPFGKKNSSSSSVQHPSSPPLTATASTYAVDKTNSGTNAPFASPTNTLKSQTITSGGATVPLPATPSSTPYSDHPISYSSPAATLPSKLTAASSFPSSAFLPKPHLKPADFEKKWTELPAVEVWGCTLTTKPEIPQLKSALAAYRVACMASGVFQGIEKYFFYVQSANPNAGQEPDLAIAEVSVAVDTQRLSALVRASSETLGAQLLEVLQYSCKQWEK